MRNRIIIALFVLIFVSMMPIKSMSHGVPADSIEKKHKITSTSLSQTLGRTAIYATEGSSGLIGASLGMGCWAYIVYQNPARSSYYISMLPMIGATAGTVGAGMILRQRGSCVGALIGSTVGMVVGIFLPFSTSDPFPGMMGCTACGAVLGYHHKRLFKDGLRSKGELLIGSAIGACAGLLLIEISKLFFVKQK